MLHIIAAGNPKKRKKKMAIKRKKKVICARKNPPKPSKRWRGFAVFRYGEFVTAYQGGKEGNLGPKKILGQLKKIYPESEGYSYKRMDNRSGEPGGEEMNRATRKSRKKRIIKARKNPPAGKRHETMIVGFVRVGPRKVKRVYFDKDGDGFNWNRKNAKIFSGDAGKLEAKRILPTLPTSIERIQVETV